MKTRFVSVFVFALAITACEGVTAEYNDSDPSLTQSDAGSTPDVGNDNGTPEASADATPEVDATPTPYVCVDEDGDFACAFDAKGEVIDCNDSGKDEDGDGIVDGSLQKPGLVEICDLIDNNCDGQIDEGLEVAMNYVDTDGDGFGDINDVEGEEICTMQGYSLTNDDCNDSDPATHPGADDPAGDGIDSDCDDETSPEDSLDVIALSGQATLTVNFAKKDKLELNVWLLDKNGDVLAGSYEGPWATAAWANTIGASFQVTDEVAAVRFNVTVGGGGNITWLCVGNGDMATVLEGAFATLELPEGFGGNAPAIWSDPSGQGCGLVAEVYMLQ